jgi:hypothetical protein
MSVIPFRVEGITGLGNGVAMLDCLVVLAEWGLNRTHDHKIKTGNKLLLLVEMDLFVQTSQSQARFPRLDQRS